MSALAFSAGRVFASRGIASEISKSKAAASVVQSCLQRHLSGDCGEMEPEDVQANLRAILQGGERVFSSYETELGKIWIITEADRSATTALFPHEY